MIMKKLLPLLFSTAIIISCNSKNQPREQAIIGTSFDTTTMYRNNVFADTATLVEEQAKQTPVHNYEKPVRYPVARKRTNVQRHIPEQNNDVAETVPVAQPAQTPTSSPVSTGDPSTSGSDGTPTSSTGQTTPAKKEGWNNATKGAVIGGIGGAIGGAILSKKKGKGAIIGGILGAGGGYVLGRAKDKKMNN